MHELGLAHEILALVQQHVPACEAPAVRTVHVRVGALAGVVVSSLDFCFEAIVSGTPWQGARLAVEHVPACAGCLDCGQLFETGLPGAGCPSCGSGAVRMVSGRELHVDAVELADEPGREAAAGHVPQRTASGHVPQRTASGHAPRRGAAGPPASTTEKETVRA